MTFPVAVEVRAPVKNSNGDLINSLALEKTQYLYLVLLYPWFKISFGTLTVCASSMISTSTDSLEKHICTVHLIIDCFHYTITDQDMLH